MDEGSTEGSPATADGTPNMMATGSASSSEDGRLARIEDRMQEMEEQLRSTNRMIQELNLLMQRQLEVRLSTLSLVTHAPDA
jgi:TolA-binding protein